MIKMNKKIIIGILIAVLIVIGLAVVYKVIEKSVTDRANFSHTVKNIDSTPVETESNQVTWEGITADGVNEEFLFKNVDKELLTQISTELQALVNEEAEEEKTNPEIVLAEGWVRVFNSERYKKVINMGSSALKPLYLIIYKSSNAGMYEYICANALYELSGYDFEWSNSKNFLERFNEQVIKDRQ